jgi:hypothetical protein
VEVENIFISCLLLDEEVLGTHRLVLDLRQKVFLDRV